MEKKLYCIEIERELEEKMVEHHRFEGVPTNEEVRAFIETLDCGFKDGYDEFEFYEVTE